MKSVDFTPIIEAVITIISLLITSFVVPYIKEKCNKAKLESIEKWVSIAVKAAEQIYGSKTGQEKREYVVNFLSSKGIKVDVDEVSTLIESEVFRLTNSSSKEIE